MAIYTISCSVLLISPLMNTLQSENNGRFVFYGMMITEAVIALIWAAVAMSLFYGTDLNALIQSDGPAAVVSKSPSLC